MGNPENTLASRLEIIKKSGADAFDPLCFCYIAALARRAGDKQGHVRKELEHRAGEALADYQRRFEQERAAAAKNVARMASKHPETGERMQALLDANDFQEMRRQAAGKKQEYHPQGPGPVAGLTAYLAARSAEAENREAHSTEEALRRQEEEILASVDTAATDQPYYRGNGRAELKAYHLLKETWTQVHADQIVTRAIKERPENAGPLNSQLLVTRSLSTLRDLSSRYLNNFVSYIDTLLWLEQAEAELQAVRNKKPARRVARKRATR